MQPNPLIIAIDPGYDRCGVAVVSDERGKPLVVFSTCIQTRKADTQAHRLSVIFQTIRALIETYTPSHIALETLFFSVNKKTALKVAEARGAIVLLAGLSQLPLIELAPQTVKIALTGTGNATKEQVEKMVRLTIALPERAILDDEIDAIALGVAALPEIRKEMLAKKSRV